MTFFTKPDTSSLPPVENSHLKQDSSAVDAFVAGFGNSYGLNEEASVLRRAKEPIREFLKQHGGGLSPSRSGRVPRSSTIERLNELRSQGIEIPKEIDFKSEDELRQSAFSAEKVEFDRRQDVLNRSSGGAFVAGLAGGIAGSFDDFENIVTLPIGAPARVGYATTALIEAGVNAGIEGLAFDGRQAFLKEIGVESDQTRLDAILEGAAFGAVGGVAFKGIADAGRAAIGRFQGEKGAADALIATEDPIASTVGTGVKAEIEAKAQIDAIEPDAGAEFDRLVREAHEAATRGVTPNSGRVDVEGSPSADIEPDINPALDRVGRLIDDLTEQGEIEPLDVDTVSQSVAIAAARHADDPDNFPAPEIVEAELLRQLEASGEVDRILNSSSAPQRVADDEAPSKADKETTADTEGDADILPELEGLHVAVDNGTGLQFKSREEIVEDINRKRFVGELIEACAV